jgi:methyl-accepting chemotaxis protein
LSPNLGPAGNQKKGVNFIQIVYETSENLNHFMANIVQASGSNQNLVEKGKAITVAMKAILLDVAGLDPIVKQTNLLPLNPAVEAPRVGEHGGGFAVMGSEGRNLANRSATAAKEIKASINESVQKSTGGSGLIKQSGKTLQEIVDSVKTVTDISGEISASSLEQASGVEEVNKAIIMRMR